MRNISLNEAVCFVWPFFHHFRDISTYQTATLLCTVDAYSTEQPDLDLVHPAFLFSLW